MLPRIFPPFPERSEFDIYATMTPAREVGGDFYDFFLVDARPPGGGHRRRVRQGRAGGALHGHRQDAHQEPRPGRHGARAGVRDGEQPAVREQRGRDVRHGLPRRAGASPPGALPMSTPGTTRRWFALGGRPYDWLPSKRGFVLAGHGGHALPAAGDRPPPPGTASSCTPTASPRRWTRRKRALLRGAAPGLLQRRAASRRASPWPSSSRLLHAATSPPSPPERSRRTTSPCCCCKSTRPPGGTKSLAEITVAAAWRTSTRSCAFVDGADGAWPAARR